MTLIAHPPRREYSFTAAQIANPAAPPPGDKLDGEVDRIHRAIANIVDWVSVSLNSDGTLKTSAQPQSQQPPVTIAGADITAEAEDWAFASADWAEHMPDTIPPNTLNIMAVTGDHWSARWWANRALEIVNAAGDSVFAVIADTPPAPGLGKFWWDSVGGQLYLYYDDGNSAQWVPATNQPGPPGLTGPPGPPGTGLSAPVQVPEGGTGVTDFPAPTFPVVPPAAGWGVPLRPLLLGNGIDPIAQSVWFSPPGDDALIAYNAEGDPDWTWCPWIEMGVAGGTKAVPAATPADAVLGAIYFSGHDGADWASSILAIEAYAEAGFAPGATPAGLMISSSAGHFIFSSAGDLTVPGTAILEEPLNVASGGTGAATAPLARANLGAAPLASPAFTGSPTAPTAAPGTNTTQLATTAFVAASSFAPLVSPNLTGNPTAPTPAPGDNDTSIATTAFVTASFAPLASPHLTGIPTAPTPAPGNSTTQLATTAFVAASIGASGGGTITGVTAGAGLSGGGTTGTVALALSSPVAIANGGTNATTAPAALANLGGAPLASPVFTGNPTAPTPSPGDNDTSIATSAFVTAAITAAPNQTITLTGDVTGSGAAGIAATLASVNPNVGTFQGITVNAKGLVTGAGNQGYLTANQTITLTGDATGSGTTALPLTLASVNPNIGTFQGITVNAKGLVTSAVNQNYAPLASPNLTGNPTAPTPSPGDNDTSLATTAFVTSAAAAYLPLAGGTLTGPLTLSSPLPVASGGTAAASLPVNAGGGWGLTHTLLQTTGTGVQSISNATGTIGTGNNAGWLSLLSVGSDAVLQFGRANGSFAAPTQILSGNPLATITVDGTYAGSWDAQERAQIQALATENWTAAAEGTAWQFSTTLTGGIATGVRAAIQAGLTVGAPTGGDKGVGTINAVSVYANNVLLTSDAAEKTDIEPLPACLDLVTRIEPKSFAWRQPDLTGRHWGFIAQDVARVMGEAGHDFAGHDIDKAGLQSLSYSDMVAVLWKAVQELSSKLAALEGKA